MNTQASSGLGSHLTPKAHSESCLRGDWPLTRYRKHREQPCSPSGPGHRGTLEPSEGWRQKDRIGGKDTHWSSVFLYLTSSFSSLWHSLLSAPSGSIPFPFCLHIRLWDTLPQSCVWFWRLPYLLLSCLFFLSALWSPTPKSSIQVDPTSPIPVSPSLPNSVDIQSFIPEKVSEMWEETCLSKRGVMGPEGTSQLPCKPASSCFSTCLERYYINDRISLMATFCYVKSLLPCWCLC